MGPSLKFIISVNWRLVLICAEFFLHCFKCCLCSFLFTTYYSHPAYVILVFWLLYGSWVFDFPPHTFLFLFSVLEFLILYHQLQRLFSQPCWIHQTLHQRHALSPLYWFWSTALIFSPFLERPSLNKLQSVFTCCSLYPLEPIPYEAELF